MIAPEKTEVTLVQITDTHLFSDANAQLLGVNTLNSFMAVIDDIKEKNISYQSLIMTGDVSQDHTHQSYQRFEAGIQPLDSPCYWLPGNHDFQPNMHSLYPSTHIQQETHFKIGRHWQVVLLDSQVEGKPHGELSKQQLDYLEQILVQEPKRFTLILLHHHPLLVGSQWLDKHSLHNHMDFWERVQPYKNVKAVLCGHVHQDFHQSHAGVEVMTSPSTCIQFKPNSNEFALDNTTPGWRSLKLKADGTIETHVYRLTQGQFLPDFDAQGY